MSHDAFDDPKVRREWHAQERACREEGSLVRSSSAREQQYRLIAQLLRHPPIDPIPANFAFETAARAELAADAIDDAMERWLVRGLIAVLASVGIVVLLPQSGILLGNLLPRFVGETFSALKIWSFIVPGCLLLTAWVQHRWRWHPIQAARNL